MTSSIVGFVSKIIKISKLKSPKYPAKYDTNLILDRPDFATMLILILKFQNLRLSHDFIKSKTTCLQNSKTIELDVFCSHKKRQ